MRYGEMSVSSSSAFHRNGHIPFGSCLAAASIPAKTPSRTWCRLDSLMLRCSAFGAVLLLRASSAAAEGRPVGSHPSLVSVVNWPEGRCGQHSCDDSTTAVCCAPSFLGASSSPTPSRNPTVAALTNQPLGVPQPLQRLSQGRFPSGGRLSKNAHSSRFGRPR